MSKSKRPKIDAGDKTIFRVLISDGSIYLGHKKGGVAHGKGVRVYPGGGYAAGVFLNGALHGNIAFHTVAAGDHIRHFVHGKPNGEKVSVELKEGFCEAFLLSDSPDVVFDGSCRAEEVEDPNFPLEETSVSLGVSGDQADSGASGLPDITLPTTSSELGLVGLDPELDVMLKRDDKHLKQLAKSILVSRGSSSNAAPALGGDSKGESHATATLKKPKAAPLVQSQLVIDGGGFNGL